MVSSLRDRPRFTEVHDASSFVLPPGSLYVAGRTDERRSQHVAELQARSAGSNFVHIDDNRDGSINVEVAGEVRSLALRSADSLGEFWNSQLGTVPYLDVTGLTHPVWAALLRAAFAAQIPIRLVYVEPLRYRFNRIRTEGELFELSVRFDGIGPLPGFLSLSEPDEDRVLLVPMLGFEGPRFSMVLSQVEIPRERIFPVIGVPGFQPEFVFFAYHGNKRPLLETESWMAVEYAAANCPFSAYYALEDIAARHPNDFLKVAPVGTKPHGIGAVLFSLANPDRVELVYDHPVRRGGRTSGATRLLVYHLYALIPFGRSQ